MARVTPGSGPLGGRDALAEPLTPVVPRGCSVDVAVMPKPSQGLARGRRDGRESGSRVPRPDVRRVELARDPSNMEPTPGDELERKDSAALDEDRMILASSFAESESDTQIVTQHEVFLVEIDFVT